MKLTLKRMNRKRKKTKDKLDISCICVVGRTTSSPRIYFLYLLYVECCRDKIVQANVYFWGLPSRKWDNLRVVKKITNNIDMSGYYMEDILRLAASVGPSAIHSLPLTHSPSSSRLAMSLCLYFRTSVSPQASRATLVWLPQVPHVVSPYPLLCLPCSCYHLQWWGAWWRTRRGWEHHHRLPTSQPIQSIQGVTQSAATLQHPASSSIPRLINCY